jgi:hypothetical protein
VARWPLAPRIAARRAGADSCARITSQKPAPARGYYAEAPFADVEQGIARREGSRLRLAADPPMRHPGVQPG